MYAHPYDHPSPQQRSITIVLMCGQGHPWIELPLAIGIAREHGAWDPLKCLGAFWGALGSVGVPWGAGLIYFWVGLVYFVARSSLILGRYWFTFGQVLVYVWANLGYCWAGLGYCRASLVFLK